MGIWFYQHLLSVVDGFGCMFLPSTAFGISRRTKAKELTLRSALERSRLRMER